MSESRQPASQPSQSFGQRMLASNYRIAVGVLLCAMVAITLMEAQQGGYHKLLEPRMIIGPLLAVVTELYFYISALRKQRSSPVEATYDARLGAALVGSACGVMLIVPWLPAVLPAMVRIVEANLLYWILFGYLSASHLAFAAFYRGDRAHGPA